MAKRGKSRTVLPYEDLLEELGNGSSRNRLHLIPRKECNAGELTGQIEAMGILRIPLGGFSAFLSSELRTISLANLVYIDNDSARFTEKNSIDEGLEPDYE